MSYEWHAEFTLNLPDWRRLEEQARAELIRQGGSPPARGKIVKKSEALACKQLQEATAPCPDAYAQLQLLSQSVGEQESNWVVQARAVYAQRLPAYAAEIAARHDLLATLGLGTPTLTAEALAILPEYSFFLYLPFSLAAPYLSKDDEPFYVHENPVRKDTVFRVPMVSSTGWKGALRAALRYILAAGDDDQRLVRLFGNPKGEPMAFRRGRLTFFPTFFDKIAVDVINPHYRHTGAGSQPIALEQVPTGARGVLALLYTPLPDAIVTAAEKSFSIPKLARMDAALTLQAIHFMLVESGFGAKTTAGMGRAKSRLPGPGYFILPTKQATAKLAEPFPLDSLNVLLALSERLTPSAKGGRHD